ncbi:uncharacterized protein LOC125232697 [Leguminivora glycinivorella]|uniref:uncharacterized protein LOC125232697 n=1 Tax=Leguminivora glycinivorella TaxID=1035111 RepID=UPI00200BEE81|nr:uncharacterized protein LOC125232697 [Leguminivora glycinivorella]
MSDIDVSNRDVDMDRVERNYAVMRLELIFDCIDLEGYVAADLNPIVEDFHRAQKAIMKKTKDVNTEFSVTVDFEQKVKSILTRLRKAEPVITSKHETVDKHDSSDNNSAKLPKIVVKPFDGSLHNWLSFKELFDSLIHKRNISNIEKLHYLMTSCQGKALDLIKNYPISDNSYMDAYNALNNFYNRKRQIAFGYYEKILLCEQVKTKSSTELEKVHRVFRETLQVLERFDLPDKNFMLFHLLWGKLDKATREAFLLEFNSNEIPKFESLQEFVEKQVRALEVTEVKPVASANKGKGKVTLVATQQNICVFCTELHNLENCKKFKVLDTSERFKVVKNKGLCVCCFSKTHKVKQCRSDCRCSICGCSHNTLLHFEKRNRLRQRLNQHLSQR